MSREPPVTAKPSLALPVVVKTPMLINGQNEHAAIITRVHDDDVVNVLLLPSAGEPYSVERVSHIKSASAGAISWRIPQRRS